MKKTMPFQIRVILCLAISLVIFLVLPLLLNNEVNHDVKLALLFLLLFSLFPVASFVVGYFAGAAFHELLYMPLVPAALFVVMALFVLEDVGVPYGIFAVVYAALSLAGLFVGRSIQRRREARKAYLAQQEANKAVK